MIFPFLSGDIDIRKFGSQGQQRTSALSLKLSEIELVKRCIQDTPVLLLDDVLSELDKTGRIIYLTVYMIFRRSLLVRDWMSLLKPFQIDKIFEVISGTVSEKNEM